MAHKLEKFYSSFGGVDTRSNKLLMDPRTFRNGSKNFRYNFQDEIQNANGWQHKSVSTPVEFVDIFEYKYRDVNTGASKSQILAVGVDGNLYRKLQHTLVWSDTGGATSYSFYYDEVSDSFKLDLNGVGSVAVSDAMTLEQLKVALNAFPAVLVNVIDNSGVTVTSSRLAYLLDVRIENDFQPNSSWYWEVVPHPNIQCVAVSAVTTTNIDILDPAQFTVVDEPFPTTRDFYNTEGYEGISAINQNNVIYITDGGFPMKYDGKTVYRAGMPKTSETRVGNRTASIPGIGTIQPWEMVTGCGAVEVANPTGTAPLAAGLYKYKYRFAFTDYNGATTYGDIIEDDIGPFKDSGRTIGANQNFQVRNRGLWYGKDFPVFACQVNGQQNSSATGASVTLTVQTGHNILPGMVIRQSTSSDATSTFRNTSENFINFNALVTQITATTITLQETVCDGTGTSKFLDFECLNGYFTQDFYINKRTVDYFSNRSITPVGAFVEVYRSKVGAITGPFYKVYDMPIPKDNGNFGVIIDDKPDTSLTQLIDDQESGSELPRACKYLTKWQGSLVQGGYPVDPTVQNDHYPSVFYADTPTTYCQESIDTLSLYTESMLCDLQSIYWADPITPEGFPQDGLHEFAIDTEFNDRVKGMAQNKDALFAFKERSTGVLTGDIGVNDLDLEILEDDVGLSSHRTIQDVKGALVWLDKDKGFYSCVAGRLPVHIGYPISDYQQINSQKLDYLRAAALNARNIDMYICAVGSTWFVYDYSETNVQGSYRNCWYIWERFNARSALFSADGDTLLLGDRIWRLKVTDTRYDMTDHKDAIEMDARTAWINFGTPTIDKRWERFWLNSIQGGFTLDIDQYGNYLEEILGSNTISFKEGTKLTVKDFIKAKIDKLSAVSIGLRNSEKNKLVRIQGFEIEYAPDYDTAEPKR